MLYKEYKIMHVLIDLQSIIEHYQENLNKKKLKKNKIFLFLIINYENVFELKIVEGKLNVYKDICMLILIY
jgi:hypothetical protein